MLLEFHDIDLSIYNYKENTFCGVIALFPSSFFKKFFNTCFFPDESPATCNVFLSEGGLELFMRALEVDFNIFTNLL